MSGPSTATADGPAAGTSAGSPFAALSFEPFRWWFLSQIASASGVMTQAVATSWLVLRMTGSALDLGVLSAMTLLPSLLLGAWCGALVDRLDRRLVLIATQSALTVLGLALYALIATHAAAYWSIVLLSAAGGPVNALDGTARQLYVLDLVGRRRLASAVSLYEVILNTSRVLGPALGGVVLVLFGAAACVLVNALSFLAPLAVLLRYRPAFDADRARPAAPPGRRGAARAGLRYAWSVPPIRCCLLIAAACGILFNSGLLFPLLADRVFHLGGGGYAALLSVFGLGALPGALLAARGGEPTGRQVAVLAGATGLCTAATACAPDPALLCLGMAAVGFTSIWMVARANTFVQLRAAPELRGRVMGAWTMALPGASPVTGLAVGALADAAGARAAFGCTGLLLLAIVVASHRALTATEAGPAPEPLP
ncbi:MFS transporter [Streptacidiphilus sp. P02-A3a]|uniref:MFS transporter n=1 Tax=Streptacidiphilus sp. P02-A3a TaxID=2704468 RepID=UPI0015FB594E|nr:MFS transporter [Streptacidiphilus sp. P02-A3a]QMU68782.1 MFS transporter [Streptacidiphilus sp. P02-A3a]